MRYLIRNPNSGRRDQQPERKAVTFFVLRFQTFAISLRAFLLLLHAGGYDVLGFLARLTDERCIDNEDKPSLHSFTLQ